MQVLGFGTYDGQRHPRIAVLLTGLSRQGLIVTEVNEPLGFSTAERVAMAGRPWLAYRLLVRLASRWAVLAVRGRRAARRRRPDAVVVGYLGQFDVILARLVFPRTTIVLDQLIFAADTARDRGLEGGLKLWLFERLDRLAVRCCDIVLVDTAEHVALLEPRDRAKAVVVAVGAPDEWFEAGSVPAPSAEGPDTALQVVFFGLFTPLQGATVIAAAIALLPAELPVRFSMLGAGQDLADARATVGDDPRVVWREWVPFAELPAEVAAHDVCLGIFGTSPKALRVVPNKVFQGAAAGRAILTSDTAPQRRALGDAAQFVSPGDPVGLAAALTDLVHDRAEVRRLQQAARAEAEAEFRAERVVGPLVAALDARAPRNEHGRS
jgi:glycosyltransferase involved in cell wall biosynthesis